MFVHYHYSLSPVCIIKILHPSALGLVPKLYFSNHCAVKKMPINNLYF